MLVSGALCRLAAELPKASTHDLPQLTRFVQRTLFARNALKYPFVRALSRAYVSALYTRRSYATTTRATKPTATVKRAVKAKAAKKPASKKKTGSATTPKRKKTAKKAVAKKAAPKKPVKRVKRALTPEEKDKATVTELRKRALREPVLPNAISGFNEYVAAQCAGKHSREEGNTMVTEASRNWKNLSPAEHEHYNHLANERTAAKRAQYQEWIQSHTPEQIRSANLARARLRAKFRGTLKSRKFPLHTAKLVDDRRAKSPVTAYIAFSKSRYASGDLKGIKTGDAAKLIANEWKALSASEKKPYQDEYEAAKARIAREKVTG